MGVQAYALYTTTKPDLSYWVKGVFETAEINIFRRVVRVNLEVQAGGGVDSGDYVSLYQIIDRGQPVLIGEPIKGKTVGTQVLTETNITGSNLKLRIESKVTASDEFFDLDNLKVEDDVRL